MPSRISSSVGFGVVAQQVDRGHDHPGRAEAALQAVLLVEGLLHRVQRAVLAAKPSMVVTSLPSAWTASTEQLFTASPSRCTVQAPQLLVSQPTTVPTLPSCSRR